MHTKGDRVFMVTMKARELFERSAAPVEAPPKPGVKPGAPPVERPGAPPAPGKHPNPFRRRWTGPQPTPRPAKACAEGMTPGNFRQFDRDIEKEVAKTKTAKKLFNRPNSGGMTAGNFRQFDRDAAKTNKRPGAPPAPGKQPNPIRRRFNRDDAIKHGRAKPLEDDAVKESAKNLIRRLL